MQNTHDVALLALMSTIAENRTNLYSDVPVVMVADV
jgi:hypothetical protein